MDDFKDLPLLLSYSRELYQFVRMYIPKSWVLPIHTVAFTPGFHEILTARIINQFQKNGGVGLEKYLTVTLGYPWYIASAVQSWIEINKEKFSDENLNKEMDYLAITPLFKEWEPRKWK